MVGTIQLARNKLQNTQLILTLCYVPLLGSGNLADDVYLRSLMDSDGWVSLEKIMMFPRMKKHKLVIQQAAFAALIIQTFPQFRGNTKANLAVCCSVYCRWGKCYLTQTQLGAQPGIELCPSLVLSLPLFL